MGANTTRDAQTPPTDDANDRVIFVISVLVLLAITISANVCQLVSVHGTDAILTRGRSYLMTQCPNVGTLFQVLSFLGLVNCISQVAFQLITVFYGGWLFGDVVCQAQGFFTNLINLLEICYVALLSFERYTHLLQPHEYSLTLSRLNFKVILVGICFILIISASGPIYGWGEYKFIHQIGICNLDIRAKNATSQLIFICSVFILIPVLCICTCYTLLIFKSELQTSIIPRYQAKNMFSGRSNIYTLTGSSLLFIIFSIPLYLLNLRQCSGWTPNSQTIFWMFWMQSFGLNACFPLCCGLFSSHLKNNVICNNVKSKCIHHTSESDFMDD